MGRQKESPRYEVISLRVSDDEKEIISNIARRAEMSVSDLLREAIQRAGLFKEGIST